MHRLHIVGLGPRTGSTLLTEAMVACFRIDAFAEHEEDIYARPPPGAEVFLTKRVKQILVAKSYLDAYPDLNVLCTMRDPRDAIVSRHAKDPGRYWAGLRYWNTYLKAWRRVAHHPRFMTIKYEDLVTEPDAVQTRLAAAMPFLEQTARFSRYHEVAAPAAKAVRALHSVRPISPQGIGAWREHLPRVAGQLALHGSLTDDLIEFGYEKNDRWMSLLDGIEPDVSPSHWPERFTLIGIARRAAPGYARVALPWLLTRAALRRA
jgi:hypothetical protein